MAKLEGYKNDEEDLKAEINVGYYLGSYNKLKDKPKINGVELKDNLTSEDLGLQSEINIENKLDSDLVSDLNQNNKFTTEEEKQTWNNKQDFLISGENIKTINSDSILGEGNIDLNDTYYTEDEIDTLLSNYYLKDETYSQDEINNIKSEIENKIPTKTSDLTNDSGFIDKSVNDLENYTKSSELSSVAISGSYNDLENKPDLSIYATNQNLNIEITNRQDADVNLQNQIDAITSASDVVDIVGTYQELLDYNTSSLNNNDVIKVLQDNTHNNALSYYRWVINQGVGSWNYIGSEGPFYTKGETDTLLNTKVNTSAYNIKVEEIETELSNKLEESDLTDYVKNTDYASSSTGGVVKTSSTYGTTQDSGILYALTKTYEQYNSGANGMFIGKGTLENVITGKDLTTKSYVDGLVGDIQTLLDDLDSGGGVE